jgi:AraC-like DNA-binding protein
MSINHTVDPETKIAIIGIHGVSNLEEIVQGIGQLSKDREFRAGYGVLIDIREMRYTPFADEAATLAEAIAKSALLRNHPVAMVASRRAQLGLAEMITEAAKIRGAVARAFRPSLGAAAIWLDQQMRLHRSGPN